MPVFVIPLFLNGCGIFLVIPHYQIELLYKKKSFDITSLSDVTTLQNLLYFMQYLISNLPQFPSADHRTSV